jgi:hypothetical protein
MAPRAPKPRLLAPTILVDDVAVDSEHVIVATQYDTPLSIMGHDGTGTRTLVTEGGVTRVVADDRGIFTAGERGVCRVDKAGSITQLTPLRPWALVLDATHVYGSVLGDYPSYANGGVFRVARDGGAIEWQISGRSVTAIAPVGDQLYFASENVLYLREPNGAIHALGPALNPHAIVALGDAIAWTEFDNGGSPRCRASAKVRTLAAQSYTSDMIVIGDWVYWTHAQRKKSAPGIYRMRLADAAPEPVAKLANKGARIAATSSLLVWAGGSNGGVYAALVEDQPPASGASK